MLEFRARQSEVVVFNENRVVQPAAMVLPASALNSVLFQQTPAGGCLSGVVNARLFPFDQVNPFDVKVSQRSNSAQPAHEVKQRPFDMQNLSGVSFQRPDFTAGVERVGVVHERRPFDVRRVFHNNGNHRHAG